MKKEISYSQFQQVKSAAKMIDPNMRKIEALKKKIMPLVAEMKQYQALNDSLEAGIVSVIGFHVSDLVKKVIEPTGAVGKDGKPIKVTKYLPTDIVTYDEQKKVYVIETPSTDEINAEEDHKLTEEEDVNFQAGHDRVEDTATATEAEAGQATSNETSNQMPWENN
jgi:hypothetical protein